MIKVGITGQQGFIGTHLYNYLLLKKDEFKLIPFRDEIFQSDTALSEFVSKCDCIIHLAAMNRHNDPNTIYSINLELVNKLISALERSKSKAHIIYSSSTQEANDSPYGSSKKIGREILVSWAKKNSTGFTGLIIPNVFGPFGKPFYNSVISTFSYQLVNNEIPSIEIDAELKLIYVNELLKIIEDKINSNSGIVEERFKVPYSYSTNVSGLLSKLKDYKSQYFKEAIIPQLNSTFDINLFNTFRSYIDYNKYYPFQYKMNTDNRGAFVEIMKSNTGGQVSFSITKPGITRGNHFHTRKIERFSIVKGEAIIKLRKYNTDEVIEFRLNGEEPSFIDIPVWYTHNITNSGNKELITIFWINEFYNPEDPDTFYEQV